MGKELLAGTEVIANNSILENSYPKLGVFPEASMMESQHHLSLYTLYTLSLPSTRDTM